MSKAGVALAPKVDPKTGAWKLPPPPEVLPKGVPPPVMFPAPAPPPAPPPVPVPGPGPKRPLPFTSFEESTEDDPKVLVDCPKTEVGVLLDDPKVLVDCPKAEVGVWLDPRADD